MPKISHPKSWNLPDHACIVPQNVLLHHLILLLIVIVFFVYFNFFLLFCLFFPPVSSVHRCRPSPNKYKSISFVIIHAIYIDIIHSHMYSRFFICSKLHFIAHFVRIAPHIASPRSLAHSFYTSQNIFSCMCVYIIGCFAVAGFFFECVCFGEKRAAHWKSNFLGNSGDLLFHGFEYSSDKEDI